MRCYANESLISSNHPQYPPISYSKGEISVGIGPDFISAIFSELDIDVKFEVLPWVRALHSCKNGKVDALNSAYMNKDRMTYMDYSIPYMKDQISIYTMKNKTFSFDDRKDLIGKKGATLRGESFGKEFDIFIDILDIYRISNLEQAFNMLKLGRVDYVIFGKYPAIHLMVEMGIRDEISILPNPVVVENVYITISHKSKYRKYLTKVNKTIEKLIINGTFEKIKIKNEEIYYETLEKNKNKNR